MDMLLMGTITALGLIFLLLKLDIRKVCGYDTTFDVALSLLLMWAMSGTLGGVMAALIAGAILSLFLLAIKKLYGYKKLHRRGARFVWVSYSPEGQELTSN